MVIIQVMRKISTPQDKIWDILSNLDKEPSYWRGMKSIRNLSRTHTNIIEREVIISYRNSKCRETVMLYPNHSIEVKITEGPIHGSKTIKLKSLEQDKTIIEVVWNIKLVGILEVFSLIVKRYIARQTEKALEAIEKEAETEGFIC